MKLVRPIPVTVAKLTSDVAQTETLWDAVTSFGAAAAVYELDADGVPMRYVSLAGSNLNHRPSVDTATTLVGTYWTAEGPTNRWAMFDGTIQTQTTQADSIGVTIDLGADEAVDTIRLGNVNAETVTVVMTDSVAGEIHNETYDLTETLGIDDYLPWFAEPIVRKTGITIADLPGGLYPGCTVEITLDAPGETAACGLCLMGLSRTLGGTKWGAEPGFRDLSTKAEDLFGGLYIVPRGFKRTLGAEVIVDAGMVDEVQRLFESYRATPVLFVGDATYDTLAIYGFVKSFKMLIAWPDRSLCTLDLESLA